MISATPLKNQSFDIILITAEYWDDHPLSPVGVIARILESKNYKVGIIEKPLCKEDFIKLGLPKLFFGVTSGSMDSMLNNYTALKRPREEDPHGTITEMPDRAVIYYCNKLKEYCKGAKIVIGGIEASLRRFAHYDYWDNKVRKSILLDSRADILVYGNGEKQILEIAERLRNQKTDQEKELNGILGTCILNKELPKEFELIPAFKDVSGDSNENKISFCKMQTQFSNEKNLAQFYDNNYLLQYHMPEYTTKELDWIYSLPYTRKLHPRSLLGLAKFSVVTHRGCFGKCNFCSLSLHQGDKIISRSEESILAEIKKITTHPDFRGEIDDLGGPAANMYGMDCLTRTKVDLKCKIKCKSDCLSCVQSDKSHSKLLHLLREARKIPGVEKIFIRSGIRYDLALSSPEYIKEISQHHLSGCLKIAPEHFSPDVLKLMNKDNHKFEEFLNLFTTINQNKNQSLRYYFMLGHPGDSEKEVLLLKEKVKKLSNVEQFQLFTPTPMTISTCMYWTGMNPFTMQKIKIIYDFVTKKKLKKIFLEGINYST